MTVCWLDVRLKSSGYHHRHFHHLLLELSPGWFKILVLA